MRLIIVSNRLPVIVENTGDGFSFKRSAGGLVQGLSASLETIQTLTGSSKYLWVGWPGATIKDEQQTAVASKLLNEFSAIPVFLDEKEMEKFYLGFCNSSIWPLFHSLPNLANYSEENYNEYLNVNLKFRDKILSVAAQDDLIWIHDYHLMLLPNLLRASLPKASIGFFLHIPFPPFETFRLMPTRWRNEIIEGLMGDDLIGFHTYGYMLNFLRAVERSKGVKNKFGTIQWNGRDVKIGSFPIGIDFKKYNTALQNPEISKYAEALSKSIGERKIILSIDRLDYSKGVANKLRAFELFLEKHREWHEKVTLVIIVVPSRIGVYEYQKTKESIDMLIGSINGKFGTIGWTPILYQYKNLPFEELTALYSLGDVLLVTPLMDGMNLVSKEFIATKQNGVLILSECAGSYEELRNAIAVNPNDVEEIASSIDRALKMTDADKISINTPIQNYLNKYNINWWTEQFINDLTQKNTHQQKKPLPLNNAQLNEAYSRANKRVFLLDYDGTLAQFEADPNNAKPTSQLIATLKKLSLNDKNKVAIISGRNKETLEKWFKGLHITLFAEHGIYRKEKGGWELLINADTSWKKEIIPILEIYSDRIPGSFVEQKEYSIVFSYRNADERLASSVASELYDILTNIIANSELEAVNISKGIEVKNTAVNKSIPTLNILKDDFDFIFVAGDDSIDEDMFRVLPAKAFSIKVGLAETFARFYVNDTKDVISALKELSEKEKPTPFDLIRSLFNIK
ncbi:MAG: bifunctional alpha,alpha-trehalose-phosphate synthase (UDP-forming)/trehalose-phosphatase [Caldisericaceae bacterium]